MSKRLFDTAGDVTEFFHYNEQTDVVTIETVQNVEHHVEMAKRVRNESDKSVGIKAGWWHFAHLPDSIILKMRFEDGVDIYDRND